MAANARRTRPARPLTEEQLHQVALRALARRAHSRFELRRLLEKRTDDRPAVRRMLQRLSEKGLLDDYRFALAFASYRARVKRFGRFRIARELRERGVPQELIERVLEEVLGEIDEGTSVRARLARRLRGHKLPLGERDVARLYRGLLRAGFASGIILRELRRLTKANVEDLAVESTDEA